MHVNIYTNVGMLKGYHIKTLKCTMPQTRNISYSCDRPENVNLKLALDLLYLVIQEPRLTPPYGPRALPSSASSQPKERG